jgi:coniferyl-aldehyde dehydrogenase
MNSAMLKLHLKELKKAYIHEPNPSFESRKERILRVVAMVNKYEENLCKVVSADFGIRHSVETRLIELNAVRQVAKHTIKHLKNWMKSQSVDLPFQLQSSKAWLQPQSKGVVGIMSPWNYPILLALVPAIAAIAAGNRVWLKPSERSARTSGYLATMVGEYFHPLEFSVTTGDAQLAADFAALPFDHLFFTGSSATGKKVMRAAADNLTPVTLELGGKSPAIIHSDASLKEVAKKIIYGKLLNGGQTCVAPDYILIQHEKIPELQKELRRAAQLMFQNDAELTNPIDKAQTVRWMSLVNDAVSRGAEVTELLEPSESRAFTPVMLHRVSDDALIMNEEIFGPILPIIGISTVEDAINYVNNREHPLALYWFGKNQKVLKEILSRTHAGGVCINDTLLQAGIDNLPFGGVGASGMGSYHGKAGFDTFSHQKPVLDVKSFLGIKKWMGTNFVHPPYGPTIEKIIRRLSK